MTIVRSAEEGFDFKVLASRVDPTEEERSLRGGRDMHTVDEEAAVCGGSVAWFQTIEVLEPLVEPNWEETEASPIAYDVAAFSWKICEVGSRYPIFTTMHGTSLLDSGDGTCYVRMEE